MNTNTTRRGKIARLPLDIRNEVNDRLESGQEAEPLLKWLNGLEPVQQVLRELFGGEAVNAQNLSLWRAGGFRDWQRRQEVLELARQLREDAEVEADGGGRPLTDCLATALALQLAMATTALQEEPVDAEGRWERLKNLLHELERLRRGEHRAARVRIARARWEREEADRERAEQEKRREKERKRKLAALEGPRRVTAFAKFAGGGPEAVRHAAMEEEVRQDLEPGTLTGMFDGIEAEKKAVAESQAKRDWAAAAERSAYWEAGRAKAKARKQEKLAKAEAEAKAKAGDAVAEPSEQPVGEEVAGNATNNSKATSWTPNQPQCDEGQSRLIKVLAHSHRGETEAGDISIMQKNDER